MHPKIERWQQCRRREPPRRPSHPERESAAGCSPNTSRCSSLVVGVALLSNGIFEESSSIIAKHKAALIRIQHEQAEAAAAKIRQFIKEIENQLG